MKVLLIIGITLVLCVAMILVCSFLTGKSRAFIDRLTGKNNRKFKEL